MRSGFERPAPWSSAGLGGSIFGADGGSILNAYLHAERRSQEDQERFRTGREQALAHQVIKPIADALRTLKDKAF